MRRHREPSFSIWFAMQVQKIPPAAWLVVIWLEFIVIYLQEVSS